MTQTAKVMRAMQGKVERGSAPEGKALPELLPQPAGRKQKSIRRDLEVGEEGRDIPAASFGPGLVPQKSLPARSRAAGEAPAAIQKEKAVAVKASRGKRKQTAPAGEREATVREPSAGKHTAGNSGEDARPVSHPERELVFAQTLEPEVRHSVFESAPHDHGRAGALEEENVDQGRVVRELSAIAFATVADLCRWDAGGVRLLDSSRLTREQAAAVAEITESSTGKGAVRIKLHPKLKALEMLGRHLGMFSSENVKPGEEEDAQVPLSDELADRLDSLFPLSASDADEEAQGNGEEGTA